MFPPRSVPAPALLLLLVAGCYPRLSITVPGVDDTGAGPDGGAPDGGLPDGGGADGGGSLLLDGLLPTDGPVTGGMEVEIVGGPFDESAQVAFGDQPALVESQSTDRLRVRSPSALDAGPVDVSVDLTNASATLPDAWTYWPDAGGQAVIVGTWLQLQIANPETWTEVAPTFDTWVRFTQPTSSEPWQRYGIAMDSCGAPVDTLSSLRGPDELLLGHSARLLSLTWSEARQEYTYQASAAPEPMPGEPLVLQALRSDQSPPLALADVARPPTPLLITGPDLAASSVPEMKFIAATVTWIPGGTHHVLIAMGEGPTTHFLCMAEDDGSFTIPSAHLLELDWVSKTSVEPYAEAWLAVTGVNSGVTELLWTDGEARFDAGLGSIGRVRVVGGPGVAP